jgi:AcrR family transcriptional regulator
MARPPEPEKREHLLRRAVEYVLARGMEGVSLRPLAAGLGTNPRVLIYHFGSKDRLVAEVVTAARRRLVEEIGALEGASPWEVWRRLSAPSLEPYWRLTLQVYGLGLGGDATYRSLLPDAVHDWLGALPDDTARGLATVLLATFGGFILDLLGTGDRVRIDAAVRLFIDMVEKGGPDAG